MVKIKERPSIRSSVVSARRVIQPKDICVLAGTYLIRYGIRTLLPALALTLTMIVGNKAMGGGKSALPFTPMIVAFLLVATGFSLKFIPVLFSKKRLTTAEARGFDQLELYRKARLSILLDQLETRVFRHEALLVNDQATRDAEEALIHARRKEIASHLDDLSPQTLEWLGATSGEELVDPLLRHRPLSNRVEASRSGFIITAHAGLNAPLSETANRAATGYDLSILIDYLDGAPFHTSDSKIQEQYQAHPVIRAALKDVKLGKRRLPRYLRTSRLTRRSNICFSIANLADSMEEKLWHAGICREVMVQSGRAFIEIDAAFPHALVTASSFLRPGDADNDYHKQHPGLPEALRNHGKQVLQRVLGNDRGDALAMIDRMKMHPIIRAFALRLSYDPEYVSGLIQPDFLSDVAELLGEQPMPERFKRYRNEVQSDQEKLESILDLSQFTPGQTRALRSAWHLNFENFRSDPEKRSPDVVAKTDILSRRLYYVRLHHCLTLLDRKEYRHIVDVVAFDAQEDELIL